MMTNKICILHSLASSNSITALNAVQTLLQFGEAKVNEREHNGLTALHVAAAWDHLAMCQLLLYYGADPFQTDIHGRTAYDVAIGETKKFFARAFKGLQKTDKSNRIMPRIGFLRALTQLFACVFVQPQNDSALRRMRHSWTNLDTYQNSENELIHRAKLISSGETEKQNAEGVVASHGDWKSREFKEMRRSVSSNELHNEQTCDSERFSDETFVTAIMDNTNDFLTPKKHPLNRNRQSEIGFDDDSSVDRLYEEERIPSDVLRVVKKFSDRSLKREFESRGVKIGPLTPSTRFAYELKLARVLSQMTVLRDEQPKKFSSVLESVIAGSSCEAGRKMDQLVKNEFFCSENWREGVKATSFCYILIDPSLLESQDTCTFVQFLRAIFYIGKGKRSRPLQHLTEAVKAKQGGVGVSPVQMTNKLRRILDVWAKGYGIVSLHVFQNTIPVEAFTREAAMIDAIGISNLTNVKKGDYYGISKDWTSKEKALYGSYLLQKALEVFRVEGCRQLFENDVHDN